MSGEALPTIADARPVTSRGSSNASAPPNPATRAATPISRRTPHTVNLTDPSASRTTTDSAPQQRQYGLAHQAASTTPYYPIQQTLASFDERANPVCTFALNGTRTNS